jgi:hypothetical protein
MQTAYEIGAGNASEALDQAAHLMERDPGYYGSLGDVIESYATNAAQTETITNENVADMVRGFLDTLAKAGVEYRPHGF